MDFLQLDAGSVWASDNLMRHYIRDGKLAQAKEIAEKNKDDEFFRMMTACFENASSADVAPLARDVLAARSADPDPEPRYVVAPDFLFCGQKDAAVQLLKSSIAGHFCAYTGLQNDSAWAKLRGTPEFAELLSAAKRCRDDFSLSERKPLIELPTITACVICPAQIPPAPGASALPSCWVARRASSRTFWRGPRCFPGREPSAGTGRRWPA